MLIAIIADTHDNLPNLDTCLVWCRRRQVANLIFCGDAGNLDTLEHLAANFSGDIFLISGNADLYEEAALDKLKNVHYFGEMGQVELAGRRLGFCHEPFKTKRLQKMNPALDFIFYGHTHKPWLEITGGITIANPGNLAGLVNQATFASLDTETKELCLHILAALED